jgi:hypothetical protein
MYLCARESRVGASPDAQSIASPIFGTAEYGVRSHVAADLEAPRAGIVFASANTPAATLIACGVQYERSALRRLGWSSIKVLAFRDPLGALDGNLGFRFRVNGTYGSQRFLIYQDIFIFTQGHAGIELEAFRASVPVPLSTERRLFTLLYSRAEAHKLS